MSRTHVSGRLCLTIPENTLIWLFKLKRGERLHCSSLKIIFIASGARFSATSGRNRVHNECLYGRPPVVCIFMNLTQRFVYLCKAREYVSWIRQHRSLVLPEMSRFRTILGLRWSDGNNTPDTTKPDKFTDVVVVLWFENAYSLEVTLACMCSMLTIWSVWDIGTRTLDIKSSHMPLQ